MIFRLLRIRKNIEEARRDPGGFAGEQIAEFAIGFLVVPAIIVLLSLILFFILGFTEVFGGPFGFFKFLFFLGLVVSLVIWFAIVWPIIRLIKRGARKSINKGVEQIKKKI